MAISESDAAQILAKCARHCCLCRRFRPAHLQIHHVIEQSQGGDDSPDNLIPICITCHADIHAGSLLTRQYTPAELRLQREAVYDQVSKGLLPSRDAIAGDAVVDVTDAIIHRLQNLKIVSSERSTGLTADATSILIASLCEEQPITVFAVPQGFTVETGQRRFYFLQNLNEENLPVPMLELLQCNAIRRDATGEFSVTPQGVEMAGKLVTTASKFAEVKVKCRSCSLHFIILTWYPEKHSAQTITCPECQQSGHFLIWRQRTFGFIFQHVPGSASSSLEAT